MAQNRTIKTKDDFRTARLELGLSGDGLASILVTTRRTVSRMEETGNDYQPHPLFCRVLEWMVNTGWRPPEFKGRTSRGKKPQNRQVTT